MRQLTNALREFCEIISKAPLHHELVWLGRVGWGELCPEPRCWVFQHPEYKGVTIKWYFLGEERHHVVALSGSETEFKVVEK